MTAPPGALLERDLAAPVESAIDAASAERPWRRGRSGALATVFLLVVFATLVRLPHLWDVPRFTDELQEILWALAIERGEIRPLTAVDSYYGPLWSYLLAVVIHLGADAAFAPRAVAMLLAVAQVALTWVVVRDMAGPQAGLIAGALLATSGGHVIINSHTARSNSVTPLLTTLVVWLVYRAARTGDGRPLAASGLLFAVALQTHVSVVALVPGLALAVLLTRTDLLIGRWMPIACALFIIGYLNMIIFNIDNGFWSLVHARALQQGYAEGQSVDPRTYLANFGALIQSLSRLLSGTIETPTSPARFVYGALAAGGLVLAARRGNPFPLLVCASMALVLPYFNPRYGPILSGRYLVPMLPFTYLGIAVALGWLFERVARARLAVSAPRAARLAAHLAAIALVLSPLAHLHFYYQEVLEEGRTNVALFSLADAVERAARPGDLVLLDETLAQEQLTAGGTDLKALRFLLEARGITYEVAKFDSSNLAILAGERPSIVAVTDVRKQGALRRGFVIETRSAQVESASGSERDYAVYRLLPRAPDAPGGG